MSQNPTPRISHVLAVPAAGGCYVKDLAALPARPIPPQERYQPAVTRGFRAVRGVAEGVSVGLALDTGQVAWGDCVGVADPVLRTEEGLAAIRQVIAPALVGRPLGGFRDLAAQVEALTETAETLQAEGPRQQESADPSRRDLLLTPFRLLRTAGSEQAAPARRTIEERPLHEAVRYGVSQAILGVAAMARGMTMAEVIAEEWGLPRPDALVPIYAQSGSDHYGNADKMIVRRVPVPHALVDNVPEQLGQDGDKLVQYARWLKGRIQELGGGDYRPIVHLDVHGALGQIFQGNLGRVLGQLRALELAVQPYRLRVSSPVIQDSREAQIEALKTLRDYVRIRNMQVELVADEWVSTLEDIRAFVQAGAADLIWVNMPDLGGIHNSVEAVLACRAAKVGVLLGGSCAETDLSARVAVHVALATRPDLIMARPGMDVDEGISLAQNEMARTLAWIGVRAGKIE